jgi:diaminopimelate decarboxylase
MTDRQPQRSLSAASPLALVEATELSNPPAGSEWPEVVERSGDGLLLDGCDLALIAQLFGTPSWVLSLTVVERNYRRCIAVWSEAYPRVECVFSMKANHLLALLRTLVALGSGFDCTGETEVEIALLAGADPATLILNGNGKSERALDLACAVGVRQVNVDSVDEARRLARHAKRHGRVVDCAVRLQLGYERLLGLDPEFEPMLRLWEGKFGVMTTDGEAERVVAEIAESPHLRFVGLHHHVGFSAVSGRYSAELDLSHHREATRELCDFALSLGVPIERLDVGGGYPVGRAISVTDPSPDALPRLRAIAPLRAYAEAVGSVVRECFGAGNEPVLQLETGRHQVQDAAVLLARVADVKRSHGVPPRRVITVDASLQQFTQFGFSQTRPQPAVIPSQDAEDGVAVLTDVVGQTCVYDTVCEGAMLGPVDVGDLVVLPTHGAYTDVSGTNFNAMPRPATVLVRAGQAALAKRQETVMDIVARHVGPSLDWSPMR